MNKLKSPDAPSQGLVAAPGPDLLRIEQRGAVLHVRLNRPAKRNAINDALVAQLHTAFVNLPEADARGRAQRRGRSLLRRPRSRPSSRERSVAEGIVHSRSWHAAFEQIQFGRVPVVAVLHGAVVGGGLELAAALPHPRRRGERVLRPARRPARPVRRRRRLGAHPAPDRRGAHDRHDAHRPRLRRRRGPARSACRSTWSTAGEGLAKAFALAERIAANAPLSNFAVMHALPRIADMAQDEGLFVESLMAAIAQGDEAAKSRDARLPRRQGGEGEEGVSAARPMSGARATATLPLGGSLEASFERRADGATRGRLDASRSRRIPRA